MLDPKSNQVITWMKDCWVATTYLEMEREKLNKKLKKIKKHQYIKNDLSGTTADIEPSSSEMFV